MDILPAKEGHAFSAGVISSAVEQHDMAFPPAWELAIEYLEQAVEEHDHDEAVGVGMEQREVDPAVRVQSCNQTQPRVNQLRRCCGWTVTRSPYSSMKLGLVDPTFIDVDDFLSLRQQVYHFQGVLLSEDQAAFRIGLHRNRTHLLVPESELLPQPLADDCRWYIEVVLPLQLFGHDCCIPYWPA